jgi:5'(3')-deoxyribonucleotidase
MKSLRVLCDADDVIECLLETWVQSVNEKYGTHVYWNNVTSWDMTKAFPTLTREQVYSPIYDNGFWDRITPMPGATEFVNNIIRDGHELYIVTATNYQTCGAKIKKLLEMFPMLKWENFIITSNKQIVNGDFLLDDAPHNLIGGSYQKVLFDRPHNHNFNEKECGIKRVFTLEEAYEEVCKLANK